jgi:hypothetical protein
MVTRVPQWMLASYLGLTPETLSRIRKNLSRFRAERLAHVVTNEPQAGPLERLRLHDAARRQIDPGDPESPRRELPGMPTGAAPDIERARAGRRSEALRQRLDKSRRLGIVSMGIQLVIVVGVEPGREPLLRRRHRLNHRPPRLATR